MTPTPLLAGGAMLAIVAAGSLVIGAFWGLRALCRLARRRSRTGGRP